MLSRTYFQIYQSTFDEVYTLKYIDLFCGIGGFRLGIEDAMPGNSECVFSSDFNKSVCESYSLNFNDFPFSDITQLNEKEIPDHDLLCAGFPCQPFSIGGLRKGFEDVRGTLFYDLVRIIKEKKPKVFILENVRGLTSHDGGKTFKTIIDCLASRVNGKNYSATGKSLNYNVFYKILNSKNFGVPQNRERIFIIGFLNPKVEFEFPNNLPVTNSIIDILEKKPLLKDISDLSKSHISKHLKSRKDYKQIKDLDHLIAFEIRKSRTSFRFDGISPCLTTKMGTGGNNVPYLVNYERFFTVRELLRIQGFPDSFRITDSYNNALMQIGNSVSVPVIKNLMNSIVECHESF